MYPAIILYSNMTEGEGAGLAARHNREQHLIKKSTFVDGIQKLKRHLEAESCKPKREQRSANVIADQIFGVRVSIYVLNFSS